MNNQNEVKEKEIAFNHRELITAMIREKGIREGVWRLKFRFGSWGNNFKFPVKGNEEGVVFPTIMNPIMETVIERVDEPEDDISVDASKVSSIIRP